MPSPVDADELLQLSRLSAQLGRLAQGARDTHPWVEWGMTEIDALMARAHALPVQAATARSLAGDALAEMASARRRLQQAHEALAAELSRAAAAFVEQATGVSTLQPFRLNGVPSQVAQYELVAPEPFGWFARGVSPRGQSIVVRCGDRLSVG